MNKYMKLSLLVCNTLLTPILAQEIEVPSLSSLAIDKVAEVLHSELVKPQSPEQRQQILPSWQDTAGILFEHYYTNKAADVASSAKKTETILERFEQKYSGLQKVVEFENADNIVALTDDGNKCCYIDKERKSWVLADIKTGVPLQKFVSDDEDLFMIYLTKDNTKAISSSREALKVWDINSGANLHTLQGHTDKVYGVCFTTDNAKAITSSADGTLKVWDINTGTCLQTLQGHNDGVKQIAITTDNTKVISSYVDKTLRVWDINTGNCLQVLRGHTYGIQDFVLSSDNKKSISISNDKTIKVWDIDTGICLRTLKDKSTNYKIALFTDNTKAIVASSDSTVKIWDLNTGICLSTLEGHNYPYISLVALTPENTKAISDDPNTTIVWDIKTGKFLQTIDYEKVAPTLIHNNVLARGNSVYKFENWQSIIDRMPKPKIGDKIGNPSRLIDLGKSGAAAGLLNLKAVKNKKIAMGLSPKSL